MILNIQSEIKRTNNLPLTAKKYNFEYHTVEIITYYSNKGNITKISIDWGFIGEGSSKSEYYYKNEKLIFIFETYIGGSVNEPVSKTEYRTYVNNDITIKYMENAKIVTCTICNYKKSSREYKILNAFNTTNIKSILCD